nr:hypothetical protein [Tanacetum cinerariifolium]
MSVYHIEHKVEEVQFHLFKYEIDVSYTKWDKYREKDEQATTDQILVNATTEFVDDTDFNMDFGSKIPTDSPVTVEMVNATKEIFNEDDLAKFQELLLDAKKPLYKGFPDFTKFTAIVKLLNLKGKYGASDKFFTELLGLLKKMLRADSQVWHTINEKFLKIAKDPRNLRLGISADGVDFNSETRHHSVWPVLSVIYNLPSWLCMKRKFIMLSVLISGYLGNDIDGFLELLVDDLYTLFETWVDTYDASTKENFNLRVVVLWMINDYPALGTLCGWPYSGFKGCVVCGKDTHCVRLFASSKQSYAGHRRYLPYNHPFRRQKKAFNGQQEFQLASNPLIEEQIYNELGIKPELFSRQEEDKTTLPPAGYTLTNVEKDIFCETLSNIKGGKIMWSRMLSVDVSLRKMYEIIKGHVQNRNRPEGCIAEETILEETIDFFNEYHQTMKTIGIPHDKHVTNENEDEKPLSAGKSSEVFKKVFQKAHLYVIQNTDETVLYIKRHKQVLKTKNPSKRIALLENEHSKSFAKWLREEGSINQYLQSTISLQHRLAHEE